MLLFIEMLRWRSHETNINKINSASMLCIAMWEFYCANIGITIWDFASVCEVKCMEIFTLTFSCRSNTDRDRERDRVTNWQINLSHYELLLLRRLMYCLIQRLFTALWLTTVDGDVDGVSLGSTFIGIFTLSHH